MEENFEKSFNEYVVNNLSQEDIFSIGCINCYNPINSEEPLKDKEEFECPTCGFLLRYLRKNNEIEGV